MVVNYADLCDLDLTPIEERRKHKGHDKKLLSRAARYNILLEKRGLTASDVEEYSSKESCYSSDHSNEIAAESCDRSSESDYEELHESAIDDESYSTDADTERPLIKKLKTYDNCLDQSSDLDSTAETAEQYL